VADVAHEHQRAAVQRHGRRRRRVDAVGVQAAREGLAALGDLLGQRAQLDAQPVAVGQHLVLGVHRGDGVFQVEDGGQRGFQHHVGHAGGIGLADGGAAVDADVQVQAVVHQQHAAGRGGVALVAGEGAGSFRPVSCRWPAHDQLAALDAVAGGVGVRAGRQRRGLVQHLAGEGDHLGAAHRVVALALLAPSVSGMASVPYSASYSEPQRALAAFSA
jgi:hypothetical protein